MGLGNRGAGGARRAQILGCGAPGRGDRDRAGRAGTRSRARGDGARASSSEEADLLPSVLRRHDVPGDRGDLQGQRGNRCRVDRAIPRVDRREAREHGPRRAEAGLMTGRNRERRQNLDELDSSLRTRLLRLDEPVDRSDWTAVVTRSKAFRRSRIRSFAVVACGVAVLALALGLSLGRVSSGPPQPRAAATPLRLALRLGNGNGLVLYSVAKRSRVLDNPAGSTTP